MKRSLLGQAVHTLGSMISGQGMQIATGIVISRVYGPPGKGMLSYAGIAVMAAVAIADGLGSAIANHCGEDADAAPASYAAAFRIIALLSAALIVPLVVLGILFTSQRPLLFVAAAFPFALYVQTMNGFYLIAHRIERTNNASLVINAGAAFVMLIAILLFHPPIEIVLALWAAGWVAGAVVIYRGLGSIHGIRASAAAVRDSFVAHVRFASRASLASLMTFLAVRSNVFIVSATLSATALGNYTLALAVGELMWQVSRAISWPAYGRVATLPFDQAAHLTAKITRLIVAIELVSSIVVYIAGPAAVKIVYGAPFADAGPALRILIPGMALYAADAILTYFLSVKVGRPGIIARVETVTLAVCVIGTFATVDRLGITGPAIATTLAYLVSFAVKGYLFVRATGVSAVELLLLRPSDLRLRRLTELPEQPGGGRPEGPAGDPAPDIEQIPA